MDRLAEKFPHRFVIVREEALQQWILASDYINVWVSTAIVDVYLAQKPCSVVWPIAPPEDSIPITMDGVETVSSYEIFAERNHGCVDGEFPIAQSKLHYYYNVDCPVPAYLQIADLVQQLLHEALTSCGKSKFTWKRIFTKRFILQVYLSFFAKHKIRFSNVFPVYRKKLREQEDIVLRDDDIFFTKREKDICKRIRAKISQGNGESGTCQKF